MTSIGEILSSSDFVYTHTIYGLAEPDTDEIRYVGQTGQDVEARYRQHMSLGGQLVAWRNEVFFRTGELPRLVTLERVNKRRGEKPGEREVYWIERLRAEGARLFNATSAQREAQSAGMKRKWEDPEFRAKVTEAARRTHSKPKT